VSGRDLERPQRKRQPRRGRRPRRQAPGRANPALSRAFQHRRAFNAARGDRLLRRAEKGDGDLDRSSIFSPTMAPGGGIIPGVEHPLHKGLNNRDENSRPLRPTPTFPPLRPRHPSASPCRFGGVRWLAIRPNTGRRLANLCIGRSGGLSRRAYCLAFNSRRECAPDRSLRRRNKALAKLKADETFHPRARVGIGKNQSKIKAGSSGKFQVKFQLRARGEAV
jgi:hypothetical protein